MSLPSPLRQVESPAARGDCFNRRCPGRAVLAHLTGRWGSLIATALLQAGTLRFSELRDRIDGISEKMLAQTLRDLEHDGLILRKSHGTVPPHVDYRLTPLGEGAAKHIADLVGWVERNLDQMVDMRGEPTTP